MTSPTAQRTDTANDEALLVAAAWRGDGTAAGELFRRHGRRLGLFAARTTLDRDLAADVVGDVFAALLARGAAYDPGKASAIGFLQTLTHRRAVDVIRSREAAHRRERLVGARDHTAHHDSADRIDVVALRPALRAALSALSEKQRTAVVERYLYDRPSPDIAAEHGINASTVKTRARDGILTLRHLMAVHRPQDEPEAAGPARTELEPVRGWTACQTQTT